MTTFNAAAKAFADAFILTKRGDEDITTLRDDAPDWIRDAVYEAHDERAPDDWIYDACRRIVQNFAADPPKDRDRDDLAYDVADYLTGTETHKLLTWLAGHGAACTS